MISFLSIFCKGLNTNSLNTLRYVKIPNHAENSLFNNLLFKQIINYECLTLHKNRID